MASPSVATPGSAGDSGKGPAPKDKQCPFCNQAFTSSSLGRHLDLYIKEKNPKPPDGLHDVDEIRKMRGHITRRHARGSSAKREGSTSNTASRPSSIHREAPQPSPSLGAHNGGESIGQKIRTRLNEAAWQATGVIRDLPTPTPAQIGRGPPRIEPKRDLSRSWPIKNGIDRRRTIEEERDEARAAELALREVLGSIKAASAKTGQPQLPFDFNPFSLSFPALCLHCLGTPQALFSSLPLSNLSTWPIDAPGDSQFEDVARHIQDCFRRWRIDCAVADARNLAETNTALHSNTHSQQTQSNGYEDMLRINPPKELQGVQDEANLLRHLEDTHKQWKSLPEQHRQDAWRLEILRAYSRSEKKRKETEQALERASQDVEGLKAQVEQLSRCQQPREFLISPPTMFPVSKEIAREFVGKDIGKWDYERLVEKWRGVVRENRKVQRTLGDDGSLDGHGEVVNGDEAEEDGDSRSGKRRRVPSAMMSRGMMDPTLDGQGMSHGLHIDGVEGAHSGGQSAFMPGRRWEQTE
ncbi:MAG: hypothetical protein M1835_004173 [Candelina submexicana]|nr:MAG: hypothetical protein M1835_004173 [Candelina submexicana]